jgi:2-polyprenyl-3-methyl-5-hydroxy-6-metoxy-1,4-benzoquinol methylase
MTNKDYIDINRTLWNAKTPFHVSSDFYDNEAFKNGASTLKGIELSLLGDITGKSVLHLQCHFGQDSLSLARMGASVTGAYLSEEAIAQATALNRELGLNAKFVCSDVYDLPADMNGHYDIVFSSYGTIVWLPDMTRWARTIARCLKPGGRFVFAETHPLVLMYDDNFKGILYSYFNTGAIEETEQGTYADRAADITLPSVTWNHSMAEVIQSLLDAGLALKTLKEYNYSPWKCFGNMTEVAHGEFHIKGMENMAPLTYALEAVKY